MTLAEAYPHAFEIVSETDPDAPWTLFVVLKPGKPDAEVLCVLQDAAEAKRQIRLMAASAKDLTEPVIAALRIVHACRAITVH